MACPLSCIRAPTQDGAIGHLGTQASGKRPHPDGEEAPGALHSPIPGAVWPREATLQASLGAGWVDVCLAARWPVPQWLGLARGWAVRASQNLPSIPVDPATIEPKSENLLVFPSPHTHESSDPGLGAEPLWPPSGDRSVASPSTTVSPPRVTAASAAQGPECPPPRVTAGARGKALAWGSTPRAEEMPVCRDRLRKGPAASLPPRGLRAWASPSPSRASEAGAAACPPDPCGVLAGHLAPSLQATCRWH